MNRIIVTCNYLEPSESIKEFVKSKFSHLFHYYSDIIRIRIELNLDSGKAPEKRFATRALIELRGQDIVAISESDNAYASINATLVKSERQLRPRFHMAKYKRERIICRMKRSLEIPAVLKNIGFA